MDTQEANLGINLGITHEPKIGIGPIGLARDRSQDSGRSDRLKHYRDKLGE